MKMKEKVTISFISQSEWEDTNMGKDFYKGSNLKQIIDIRYVMEHSQRKSYAFSEETLPFQITFSNRKGGLVVQGISHFIA